jgi:hypothetical protein
MTKEAGVVVVNCQVPGLGQVLGTKTEREILGGSADSVAAAKEEPAVVTKPLAAKKPG